jgi:hypothetical protein
MLSVAGPSLLLAVFAILFNQLRPSVWAFIALLFSVVNVTTTLVGDSMQHVVFHATDPSIDKGSLWMAAYAIRDTIGNNFLYLALAIFGVLLLVESRRWVGGLAVLNAILGWLDLAFANQLGLPPHTNFLVIVVWLVVLGFSTLKLGQTATEQARPVRIANTQLRSA